MNQRLQVFAHLSSRSAFSFLRCDLRPSRAAQSASLLACGLSYRFHAARKRIEQAAISPDGTQSHTSSRANSPSRRAAKRPVRSRWRASWSCATSPGRGIPSRSHSSPTWRVTFRRRKSSPRRLDGSAPVKRAEIKGYAATPSFSPDGSKLALLMIEGIPRIAGPLQPMTPLAGVIDDKVYEQRLATIDLATNTLTQVTPAGCLRLRVRLDARRTRLGSHRRTWLRRRELVHRETLSPSTRSREPCARSTLPSGRSPSLASRLTASPWLSSKDL